MFALMLTALVAFVALVVDVGHLWLVRGELQNAADAAALGAVRDLNGTSARFPTATAAAPADAKSNVADGTPVELSTSDIVLGKWSFANRTFMATQAPAADVNAAKVTARRTSATGTAVQMVFARLIGIDEEDVRAVAIAVGGGPSSTCGFVLALPSCSLNDGAGNLNCGGSLTFNSTTNNAAFTLLSMSSPNTPDIECAMACALGYYPRASSPPSGCNCPSQGCTPTTVASNIKISNGTNLSSNMITYLQWAVAGAPGNLYVQVPVFAFPNCGGNLSNEQTIMGYARLKITGATGSPQKSVQASVDCSNTASSLPAQGFFGYKSTQVYLAQ